NITQADQARLAPGSLLNDEIINFCLKAFLQDLKIRDPDLACQIHIFESFFYKQ
ncbi:hypothetical protein B0H12DRAFT_991679, partial [Mycena haematopus]